MSVAEFDVKRIIYWRWYILFSNYTLNSGYTSYIVFYDVFTQIVRK